MSIRGLGHLYKRGNVWWVKFHSGGRAHYESSGSSIKSDAIDLLKKRINSPRGHVRSTQTKVGELLTDLSVYYQTHNPKSYKSFAIPSIGNLRDYWGDWKAGKVTTQAINEYTQHRREEEAAPATINRELALLRRAYKLASEATPPKVGMIPKFELLPEAAPRSGFLSVDEYRALLAELPEILRPVLIVGYHTGARKSEVLNIRKSQVHMDTMQIILNPGETKNNEGRYLPIYGDMVECLRSLVSPATGDARPNSPWLFQRANGDHIVSLRPAWDRACRAAGVPGLLFHDLRRSAVRNMIRAGIPQKIAMKISGHKTIATFNRYNIVDEQDIADAGKRMAEFMKPKSPGDSSLVTELVTAAVQAVDSKT
jgi:integrase